MLLAFGLVRKLRTKQWDETVVHVDKKGKLFPGLPDNSPTIRNIAHDGNTYEKTSLITQRPSIAPSKNVPVMYNPDNPERAVINTFAQNGTAFIIIGSVTLGIGIIFLTVFTVLYYSRAN